MSDNKELERLVAGVSEYEAKAAVKTKKNKIVLIVFLVVFIPLYLYLRLFNTTFEVTERSDENCIKVKYSTAWCIKFPAQFEGKNIDCVENEDFEKVAPYVRVVDIEDGIEEIAGLGSSSTLMKVKIPASVWNICHSTFVADKNLKWVDFAKEYEKLYIGDYAFAGTAITDLVLPEGCKDILDYVFFDCKQLKSASIPDSVELFGTGIFSGCTKLQSVNMQGCTVDRIHPYMFEDCKKLKTVDWPENLAFVPPTALENSGLWKGSVSELNLPATTYFAMTKDDVMLDEAKELAYAVTVDDYDKEVVENMQQATEPNVIWLEGVKYTLPMYCNRFESLGNWELGKKVADGKYVMKNTVSGATIEVWVEDDYKITGVRVESSECDFILPGGINSYRIGYNRACKLAWDNGVKDLDSVLTFKIGDDEAYLSISMNHDRGFVESASYEVNVK